MDELNQKFPEVERATRSCKHRSVSKPTISPSKRPLTSTSLQRDLASVLGVRRQSPIALLISLLAERRSTLKMQPAAVQVPLEHLEPHSPELGQLISQWQKLWLLAVARQKHLEQHLQALKEVPLLFLSLSPNIPRKSSFPMQCLQANNPLFSFFFLNRWKNLPTLTLISGESVTCSGSAT